MRNMAPSLIAVGAAFLLAGCGVMSFQPIEYSLRDGLIDAFPVVGDVAVTNDQPSTAQTIVYSEGLSTLGTTLNAITEVMAQQTLKELDKAGQPRRTGAAKRIVLQVSYLRSTAQFFSFKSRIDFSAKLGDGQVLDFQVYHASGVAMQDLNGCIAEGVMTLLNDARVKIYLGGG